MSKWQEDFDYRMTQVNKLSGKDKAGPKGRDALHPDFKADDKWKFWVNPNPSRLDQVRKPVVPNRPIRKPRK